MASVHDRNGVFWVKFRFGVGNKQFYRSLGTTSEREASQRKAQIERTLDDIKRGRLALPGGADFWQFVISDGRLAHKPDARPAAAKSDKTLAELFAAYFSGQERTESKEKNTLVTERLHSRNLLKVLGADKPVKSLVAADAQGYIDARSDKVQPATIRKEVETLRHVTYRADRLIGEVPPGDLRGIFKGLNYPKTEEKHNYMSWAEIEQVLSRRETPATPEEAKAYWDRLFLSAPEVAKFLDWAEQKKSRQPVPFLPPLFTAACHTGARLSELTRSKVEDWSFETRVVVIREKKRSKLGVTFRRVPISGRLAAVMRRWFAEHHPGGHVTFCCRPGQPLNSQNLTQNLDKFTRRTEWSVLRGWHTFRHSFASNLAREGVDPRVVDELMGHQTEAMRKRYGHFFPESREEAVRKVFG